MVVGKQQPRLLHGALDSVTSAAGSVSRVSDLDAGTVAGFGKIEKVPTGREARGHNGNPNQSSSPRAAGTAISSKYSQLRTARRASECLETLHAAKFKWLCLL